MIENNQIKVNPPQSPSSENEMDIKKLVLSILRNWYWFALCVIVAMAMAFLFNRYSIPYFNVRSSILVDEGKSSTPLSGGLGKGGDVLEGFNIMGGDYKLLNQMVILKSKPLVTKAIEELDFEISYYAIGNVITAELYKNAPFRIEWDEDRSYY